MLNHKSFRAARKYGYRSGIEHQTAEYLDKNNISYRYEKVKIEWEDLSYRTYTPDFVLQNGIIIETKGRFTSADRRKHIEIKKQHRDSGIKAKKTLLIDDDKNNILLARRDGYQSLWLDPEHPINVLRTILDLTKGHIK